MSLPSPPSKHVVALGADERVVAGAAFEQVVAAHAAQEVVAAEADDAGRRRGVPLSVSLPSVPVEQREPGLDDERPRAPGAGGPCAGARR